MAHDTNEKITRRNLLFKLGLAAGAAYVAPTLVGLDVARASSGSGSGASGASGPSSSSHGGSGPSRYSHSVPSRGGHSRPSRPNARSDYMQWRWNTAQQRWTRVKVKG